MSISSIVVFAQGQDFPSKRNISIGFTFSPDYGYRILKPDDSSTSNTIATNRDGREIPGLGLTTGINVSLKIKNRIHLETGLLYAEKGYTFQTPTFIYIGPVDPTIPKNAHLIYKYHYLDVPIKLNYYFLTGGLKLYGTAGISPNIFIGNNVYVNYQNNTGNIHHGSNSSNNFNKINLAVITGLGLQYDLNNKLYIKAEPVYRRSITSIKDAPIKEYLYSFGINSGIYINL
ncbi:MAG: PorT family protein [Bacteroidetes bacterium]|nr:PorT family protein [Bacteroidota bacterium]